MCEFLLYEPILEVGMQVLRPVGQVRMASATDEETIIAEIGAVDGVIMRARGAMTRRMMEHAPKLRVVGRHGVGVDNIDLEAATDHGIQVVNTPLATVESVAEHTVGLMIAVSKSIVHADAHIRGGDFGVRYSIRGREMRGRTLGVIGFGRIGRRVGQICRHAFDMTILYHDVRPAPEMERELGARRVDLAKLLEMAEYITVHVPLLPKTRGMIGEKEFCLMRPEAMFFNTSRGAVADEPALYRALAKGRIRGAGIDVYQQEPTPPDNPLFELDNVVLTPHIASSTEEAMMQMSLVAEDVVAVLEGRQPRHPVNRLRE